MIPSTLFYVYKANHGPGSAAHFHEVAPITLVVCSFRHRCRGKAKNDSRSSKSRSRHSEFGRWAEQDRKRRGAGKPETFNFLGFTHSCGKHGKGYFALWRKTTRKRMAAKLKQIKQQHRQRRHEPIPSVGKWLQQIVTGYYNYHAVPGNLDSLTLFRARLSRLWRGVLRQRGDQRKLDWKRFARVCFRNLPPTADSAPVSLSALQRHSSEVGAVCVKRAYGSVRGAAREGCPYRDQSLRS